MMGNHLPCKIEMKEPNCPPKPQELVAGAVTYILSEALG